MKLTGENLNGKWHELPEGEHDLEGTITLGLKVGGGIVGQGSGMLPENSKLVGDGTWLKTTSSLAVLTNGANQEIGGIGFLNNGDEHAIAVLQDWQSRGFNPQNGHFHDLYFNGYGCGIQLGSDVEDRGCDSNTIQRNQFFYCKSGIRLQTPMAMCNPLTSIKAAFCERVIDVQAGGMLTATDVSVTGATEPCDLLYVVGNKWTSHNNGQIKLVDVKIDSNCRNNVRVVHVDNACNLNIRVEGGIVSPGDYGPDNPMFILPGGCSLVIDGLLHLQPGSIQLDSTKDWEPISISISNSTAECDDVRELISPKSIGKGILTGRDNLLYRGRGKRLPKIYEAKVGAA